MTSPRGKGTNRGMRNDEVNPREPEPRPSADVPAPPNRDVPGGTEDVPEPPNKDEIQPGDDVNAEAGTIEPPD
ncbi:hypothetical protein FHX69_2167 [Prauserella muralis]|nr:hypothetical protein FHX69_2167 [Prauserella muralis]